jgi:hypothetical protein
MAMSVSVNLMTSEPAEPRALVLELGDGKRFVSIVCGELSVILPGFDGDVAAYARRLGDAVLVAAASIDRELADARATAEAQAGTPEGLCTKCSATGYCAEHQPEPDLRPLMQTLRDATRKADADDDGYQF